MLQSNLGLRKEDGVVSSVMFNNWKNGVLVDKESKYKTIAGLVLGAELVLSLSGAYLFTQSQGTQYFAAATLAGCYAVYGLATAIYDSIPKPMNLLHSNFSSILLSIYMLLRIGGNMNEAIPYMIVTIPFLVDGLFSLFAIYTAFVMDFSQNLKQELIEGASANNVERKYLPILFDRVERYVYSKTDKEFMPELCNESFKNKAFKLEGQHIALQLTSVFVIFAEIYLSILSAARSEIAPVFSVFVAMYAIFSLYSFFGIENSKFVLMGQSYAVGLKLAAVSLGYLFESFRNGGFQLEISFILMTTVLVFDALLGYSLIVSREDFSNEPKNYQVMGHRQLALASDNWKNQQFRNNNTSEKITAFTILSFEMIFALAAFVTFSGFQQIIAAAASIYSVSALVGYFRYNFAQNIFTSYLASAVLTAVMMIGFIEFSIAYIMLVTPFAIDSLVGLNKLRQAFSAQSEGGFVKPTFTKEFVFTSSSVDTI